MLILTRTKGQSIVINENCKITVIDIRTNRVRLAVEAPTEVPVHRQEVQDRIANNGDKRLVP